MKRKLDNKGFSLIEILIVLGLIAGIVAFIATRIGKASQNAKVKQAKLMMKATGDQLDLYKDDCDGYPTTAQGLKALTAKPGDSNCENWGPEAYSKDVPKDAWGREFGYESDGTDYEIISFGADKRAGGTGADEDISSKKIK